MNVKRSHVQDLESIIRGVAASAVGTLAMDSWLYRAYRHDGGGAVYGLLLGSRRKPKVWFGVPFGAAVWASGYVVLPLLGVYKPIWKYDLATLRKDLGAHLVFGTVTAGAFCLLGMAASPGLSGCDRRWLRGAFRSVGGSPAGRRVRW